MVREKELVESVGHGKRKTREGIVVSDKMDKTVVVVVERVIQHAKYKKRLKRRVKVKAHDQKNQCGIGDRVVIAETRPLSRDKRWAVQAILEKAV
ncbi:MAG: 30S ribosomal protein S17 [Deltaproteobacteria bacterium]|nr:30S ribosomal protein S17 [Deltaproteobacteria bacterium]